MQPHVALAILGATVIAIPAKHEDVTHLQVQFHAGSIFASGVQYHLCARHHSTDTSKQHVVSKIVFSVHLVIWVFVIAMHLLLCRSCHTVRF